MKERLPNQSKNKLLPLTLAIGNYDRTRPLIDGRVQLKGITLSTHSARISEFCLRPMYEEFDVSEMSLSWYVMARCQKKPVIAIPVFPLRMPVHGFLFCRSDAPFSHPKDLVGKRIGTDRYRLTVNLWLRGIFSEFYGVRPRDVTWITLEEEGAAFSIPPEISVITHAGANLEDLLLEGEIDCIFSPIILEGFARGDKKIRRLFPDCKAEFETYFKGTGIFPITHTIVMKEDLFKREPWVAEQLFFAFRDAQRLCEDFYYSDPKHLTLPRATFLLEEERSLFGSDPWAHGLSPNRHVLETFVRYAHEQGYVTRKPSLEELFPQGPTSL